ncbi:MAG: spore coat U domain-containing protein [Polyangiaceae bacterium]
MSARGALALALGLGSLLFAPDASALLCTISTTSAVAFNNYNVFSGTPTDAVGSITFECILFLSVDVVVVDLSTGNGGSYFPRRMSSGANTLNYNLYFDAARMQVWGNGSGGTTHYGPLAISSGPLVLSVYGRIPALQNAVVGSYTDTVVVTTLF